MTIGCIIQARTGSTRFPEKVLKKINYSTTVLEFCINQIKYSKLIKKIIIATTNFESDNKIVDLCKKMNVSYFRGESKDVLDRYYNSAIKNEITDIVRITSDNPLIDPEMIDQVIKKYIEGDFDYVTNFIPRTFPYGTEVEIISLKSLKNIWQNAKKPSEREHVTSFVKNNPDKFKIGKIINNEDFSNFRWTVDRKNDLELVKILVSKISTRPIKMNDILNILSVESDLININKNNIKDEGYKKSLEEDKMTN